MLLTEVVPIGRMEGDFPGKDATPSADFRDDQAPTPTPSETTPTPDTSEGTPDADWLSCCQAQCTTKASTETLVAVADGFFLPRTFTAIVCRPAGSPW